jgi:hypothetical protein
VIHFQSSFTLVQSSQKFIRKLFSSTNEDMISSNHSQFQNKFSKTIALMNSISFLSLFPEIAHMGKSYIVVSSNLP